MRHGFKLHTVAVIIVSTFVVPALGQSEPERARLDNERAAIEGGEYE